MDVILLTLHINVLESNLMRSAPDNVASRISSWKQSNPQSIALHCQSVVGLVVKCLVPQVHQSQGRGIT